MPMPPFLSDPYSKHAPCVTWLLCWPPLWWTQVMFYARHWRGRGAQHLLPTWSRVGRTSTRGWGTEWPGLDCPAYHYDSENKNYCCCYLCKDDSPHLMRPLDLGPSTHRTKNQERVTAGDISRQPIQTCPLRTFNDRFSDLWMEKGKFQILK